MYQSISGIPSVYSTFTADFQAQLIAAGNNSSARYDVLATGWIKGPLSRGTASIVWNYLVTLAACVYTVLHLNIPPQHRTVWQNILSQTKWTFSTLNAPHVTVCAAFVQYIDARRLVRELRKLQQAHNAGLSCPQTRNSTLSATKQPSDLQITMEYGFWVVMGGFVTSIENLSDTYNKVTLTVDAVLVLAKSGRFLAMPGNDIADRSKANVVGKVCACISVAWMVIQCIVRVACGYPLALLEIHTGVFALSALILHYLWRYKPLDVQQPKYVDLSAHSDILALMVLASAPARYSPWKQRLDELAMYNMSTTHAHQEDLSDPTIVVCSSKTPIEVLPGQTLECGLGLAASSLTDSHLPTFPSFVVSEKEIKQWELAARALRRCPKPPYNHTHDKFVFLDTVYSGCWRSLQLDGARNVDPTLFQFNAMANNDEFLKSSPIDYFTNFLSCVLSLVYSGIHLGAWAYSFPTFAEGLIWKVSCFGIIALEVADVIELLSIENFGRACPSYVTYIRLGLSLTFRAYLLLESFLSLRKCPIGVFLATPWLQHFALL